MTRKSFNLLLTLAVRILKSSHRPDKPEISLVVSDGGKVRFDGLVLDPEDVAKIDNLVRSRVNDYLQICFSDSNFAFCTFSSR